MKLVDQPPNWKRIQRTYHYSLDIPEDVRIWCEVNQPLAGYRIIHSCPIRIWYTGKVERWHDAPVL